MSDKEKAIQLIKEIPDNKMIFVVEMLKNIKGLLVEEIEPDDFDLRMIQESRQENDGTKVSLEDLLKKDGITHADLQG